MVSYSSCSFLFLFLMMGTCIFLAGCSTPVTITLNPEGDAIKECGISTQAVVIRVIDGDTIVVQYPGGKEETVRILGIDTPETEDHGNWGNEYTGISDPSYLTEWGHKASEYTQSMVKGKTITLTSDCQADLYDQYGRRLSYVDIDRNDLGALLISEGYARVYTEETFDRKSRYLSLQSEAQRTGAGLWSGIQVPDDLQNAPVTITTVQFDAPGDDRDNLNGEYIVITSRETVNLSGWTVADNSGTVYTFGDEVMHPGITITLHIGHGAPTETDLYWNLTAPLLGNDIDSVTLRDPGRNAVSVFRWGS